MIRIRGLAALITETVEHGATAVERIHLETAARPFKVLEQVPGLAAPAAAIHGVHDLVVRFNYSAIRTVAKTVQVAADTALALAERR